ncbi:unnamed protein product [Trichobilharzia szidati]|nr:unnamed protein product [Trichobilharzia szidati]
MGAYAVSNTVAEISVLTLPHDKSSLMMPSNLALGFAVSGTPWHLISHLFPDKIGGRPAWLALSHLPSPSELACPVCSNPMCFVLQLYSPLSEKADCFHRMLFLFMCRKGECHHEADQTPFFVFRSQLPRKNCYYSFEPPENEYPNFETVKSLMESNCLPCAAKYCSLCPVCGCKADKMCSKCKNTFYCSKVHQVLDWKRHKSECGTNQEAIKLSFEENSFLLPEYRLCSEPADDDNDSDDSDDQEESGSEISESEPTNDDETKALEAIAKKETKEETRFRKFKESMKSAPDQVGCTCASFSHNLCIKCIPVPLR